MRESRKYVPTTSPNHLTSHPSLHPSLRPSLRLSQVFLGLGLPWLIASIYWEVMGPNDLWKER